MSSPISWHELTIEGDAGVGIGLFPAMRGWIESIHYEPHATTPLDVASTLIVNVLPPTGLVAPKQTTKIIVLTGIVLATELTFYPRTPAHDSVGAAIAGTALPVPLANAQVECRVSGAVATEFGHFLIHFRRA